MSNPYRREFPVIDPETLPMSEADKALVRGIVATRGENKGRLRASCPSMPKKVRVRDASSFSGWDYVYADQAGINAGRTAYIWRHVAFNVSPDSQHHCMPCTDIFYIQDWTDKAEIARLDAIVDVVVKSIDPRLWYGVNRWGRALGMIG